MGHRADDRALLPADDWADAGNAGQARPTASDTGYGLGVSVRDDATAATSITHTGEAVGFLSANTVYPDDRGGGRRPDQQPGSGDAYDRDRARHRQMILPPTRRSDAVGRRRRLAPARVYDQLAPASSTARS